MDNYLLRYAIDNVWQNLGVDRQYSYKLRQVTPRYGVRSNYVVDQVRYSMPTNTTRDYYHVYQIGQVIPVNLGLGKKRDTWVKLTDIANDNLTLVSVYQTSGIRYSMSETYVMVTGQSNLLVAVKLNDHFPALDDNDLFIHFYHNAYFETPRSVAAGKRWLYAESSIPANTGAIRQLQIKFSDMIAAKGGTPMCFVNGYPVNEISITSTKPGDTIDFVLDPSIKQVVELNVAKLKVFNSKLDSERKYILHYPGNSNVINFYDDLTVQLVQYAGQNAGQFKGVTYHHNKGTWLRQLTHRDYSISVGRITDFMAANPFFSGIKDMFVRMYIRESAYTSPVVADANRIQELYRLSDANILANMTGTGANNPLWRAENLEETAYVRFMSAPPSFVYPITYNEPALTTQGKIDAQNFAGEVFGYHECAKLMNDNPAKVYVDEHTGKRVCDLAFYFWRNVTLFEYDKDGLLLGWYYQAGGTQYTPVNEACELVEAVTGKGSDDLHGIYGNGRVEVPFGYNFRAYVCKVWGGIPTNEWIDITEAEDRAKYGFLDQTDLDNPAWVWTVPANEYLGYIRTDEYFYIKRISFTDRPGVIRFTVAAWEEIDGVRTNKTMEIPFGELDLFMNRKSMISGLDYIDNGTMVVVSNLEARVVGGPQDVVVRGTGFCSPDLKRYPPGELGFVEYGVLSNDSIYQIHTHKVQRIVVDGRYMDYHDVVFEEERSGRVMDNVRNGAPYQIQTPQSVLKSVFKNDIVARVEDDERDRLTSEAMTFYFPKRVRNKVDVIDRPYMVYSAFSNKVLTDILSGTIKPPFVNGQYSDMELAAYMSGYAWLAAFDILNTDYNTNHVRVYPHWQTEPVGLTDDQYTFYRRTLKQFLRQQPEIAPFVYIKRS